MYEPKDVLYVGSLSFFGSSLCETAPIRSKDITSVDKLGIFLGLRLIFPIFTCLKGIIKIE